MEEFVAAQATVVAATLAPTPTPETVAMGRAMLDTVAKPEFAEIMTKAVGVRTVLMQMQTPFTDVTQEQWANEVFLIVKGLQDDLDSLRKSAKALSNLYNKSVDGALKPTSDLLDWCQATIEKPILAWRKTMRDRAALEAASGQNSASQPIEVAPGVMASSVGVPAPATATSGDRAAVGGGSVGGRAEIRVEVVDKLALLKAIVSSSERNEGLTAVLVDVNEKAVIALWKEGKKRVIPGLNIYEGEKLVGKRRERKKAGATQAPAATEAAATEKK